MLLLSNYAGGGPTLLVFLLSTFVSLFSHTPFRLLHLDRFHRPSLNRQRSPQLLRLLANSITLLTTFVQTHGSNGKVFGKLEKQQRAHMRSLHVLRSPCSILVVVHRR
mmetsp:Transcript_18337/g.29695  ORF Transcript_18337/g.29695 Transcript_18337/m.29695 type:complete len:108 (-) Transcript_18337:13-336(-)